MTRSSPTGHRAYIGLMEQGKTCIIDKRSELQAQSSRWLFKSPLVGGRGILWRPHYRPHGLLSPVSRRTPKDHPDTVSVGYVDLTAVYVVLKNCIRLHCIRTQRKKTCPATHSRGAGRVSGQGGQNSARSAENFFFVCPPWFSVCPPCHT